MYGQQIWNHMLSITCSMFIIKRKIAPPPNYFLYHIFRKNHGVLCDAQPTFMCDCHSDRSWLKYESYFVAPREVGRADSEIKFGGCWSAVIPPAGMFIGLFPLKTERKEINQLLKGNTYLEVLITDKQVNIEYVIRVMIINTMAGTLRVTFSIMMTDLYKFSCRLLPTVLCN